MGFLQQIGKISKKTTQPNYILIYILSRIQNNIKTNMLTLIEKNSLIRHMIDIVIS